MRRFASVVALLFLVASLGLTQDGAPKDSTSTPSTWSGSWNAEVKNHYFGPVVGAVFADEPVVWNVLTLNRRLDAKTTISATLWNSEGFERASFGTFANETDLVLGLSRSVGKFAVSATGSIFLLNPNAGFDALVLQTRVSRTFARGRSAVTPYLETQWYGVTKNVDGLHGGLYPFVGANYARKLNGQLSLLAHYHEHRDLSGAFNKRKNANLFYAETGLRIAVTESFSVTAPRIGYGGSWDDPGRPRKTTISIGIAKTF